MLVPSPDLAFIFLRMLMSSFFNGVGGVLTDNFIGILIE